MIIKKNAEYYFKEGNVLLEQKIHQLAIEHYQKAIDLNPNYYEAYTNLGNAFGEISDFAQAIHAYLTATAINPHNINAYFGLAMIYQIQGNAEIALNLYKVVLIYQPDNKLALNNSGNILARDPDKIAESINYFLHAISLDSSFTDAYINLATAYLDWGKPDDAISILKQAPTTTAKFYSLLGWAYYLQNKLLDAKNMLEKAIELAPDSRATAYYASTLIKLGDYQNGWQAFESRWKLQLLPLAQIYHSYSRWGKNEDINGKKILLYTEQGLGDSIHFIRYASVVANLGATVILHCEPELIELFRSVEGVNQVVSKNDLLPEFDVYCPLVSLPLMLNTTLDTIPAEIPYLKANQNLSQHWNDKISKTTSKLKVGLAWAGNPRKGLESGLVYVDRRRSIALSQFETLSDIEEIIFYSLQKGEASLQIMSSSFKLIDFTDELNDFIDTAALIENLDLIITVDTAVAHLAAAMGKPTWILNRFDACWRWLHNRNDSPWYPTVRLFRQEESGDWESVIKNVKLALIEFTNNFVK